uniref:Putative secreted protein n=1 Tax=Anopheles darlingi TaxID=43151 RepID=A0A2M4DFP3_ANODA
MTTTNWEPVMADSVVVLAMMGLVVSVQVGVLAERMVTVSVRWHRPIDRIYCQRRVRMNARPSLADGSVPTRTLVRWVHTTIRRQVPTVPTCI